MGPRALDAVLRCAVYGEDPEKEAAMQLFLQLASREGGRDALISANVLQLLHPLLGHDTVEGEDAGELYRHALATFNTGGDAADLGFHPDDDGDEGDEDSDGSGAEGGGRRNPQVARAAQPRRSRQGADGLVVGLTALLGLAGGGGDQPVEAVDLTVTRSERVEALRHALLAATTRRTPQVGEEDFGNRRGRLRVPASVSCCRLLELAALPAALAFISRGDLICDPAQEARDVATAFAAAATAAIAVVTAATAATVAATGSPPRRGVEGMGAMEGAMALAGDDAGASPPPLIGTLWEADRIRTASTTGGTPGTARGQTRQRRRLVQRGEISELDSAAMAAAAAAEKARAAAAAAEAPPITEDDARTAEEMAVTRVERANIGVVVVERFAQLPNILPHLCILEEIGRAHV